MNRIIMILTILLFATSIFSENKYALVIGNSNYDDLGSLKNPTNDATDMAEALKKIGFIVNLIKDADLQKMEESVADFKRDLAKNKDNIGLFYYAGHGIQSKGENFLIPSRARIDSENYLKYKSFSVNILMDELKYAGNSLNMVILDACRDNPFGWNRSGSRGLTVVGSRPTGSIVVYATSEGEKASDGNGRNGLFTGELLKNITKPNIDISEVFRLTGAAVQDESNGEQIPAIYNKYFGKKTLVKQANYKAPTNNNITFVEQYGSLQINVVDAGDLYLNGSKLKSFKKGESSKIPKLKTGSYNLEYRSSGNTEKRSITITDSNVSRVKFLGEAIAKKTKSSDKKSTPIIQKGKENGNSHETTFQSTSSKVRRVAYFPICQFMPLPSVITIKIYNMIEGDINGIGEKDYNRDFFDKYYIKQGSNYILNSIVSYQNRPELWGILDNAGYDVVNAAYKFNKDLKTTIISFELNINSNVINAIKSAEIVSSCGDKKLDEAILYGFRQSIYSNRSEEVVKGVFKYYFK
ncbi:MAG: caspase family protein [Spirochaetaceae bacterium]